MEEKSKIHDIYQKSDYVNDVLEKTPTWIISWGNTFFLLFLLLLLALAAFIKYPDTLLAPMRITLNNPPLAVIAEKSELIEKMYYKNKDQVKKGDLIIQLFSRANYEDLQELKKSIAAFQQVDQRSDYQSISFTKDLDVGEISAAYQLFLKELADFKYFLSNDMIFKKINSLEREIKKTEELNASLRKQEELFEAQFQLAKKNYERNLALSQKDLISDLEKEQIERDYLTESRSLENFRTNQINNEIKVEQLRAEINDLRSSREQEFTIQKNKLEEQVSQVNDQIKAWEDVHLMRAPLSGRLSCEEKIVEQYFVTEEEAIFDIIPSGANEIIGLAEMPVINSGEVQVGDLVQIRLDAFPYQEYGILESRISELALLPKQTEEGVYSMVQLEIPDSLKTIYGKEIPFMPNMTGTALIVKKDKSLLARIFDQLVSLFAD
ncbi:MAG: hypothetical protein AAFP19_16575 [Bacteroidota bacterium]